MSLDEAVVAALYKPQPGVGALKPVHSLRLLNGRCTG